MDLYGQKNTTTIAVGIDWGANKNFKLRKYIYFILASEGISFY